jgi:hypothetical protein
LPVGWTWTAGVRVRWGAGRCTYVIDGERQTVFGDMREASADEPYRCVYAGTDVSGEVITSPIEVGAIAFEDEGGAVRAFICNLLDAPRDVSLEFRGRSFRRHVDAGQLVEVALAGTPLDREAYPARPDAEAGRVAVTEPA